MIRAIVSSARAQGIAVTAEGIETEARLDLVRKLGFTHAQGFLIGMPLENPTEILEGAARRASAWTRAGRPFPEEKSITRT